MNFQSQIQFTFQTNFTRTVLQHCGVQRTARGALYLREHRSALASVCCAMEKWPDFHTLVRDEWCQHRHSDSMCDNPCAIPSHCASWSKACKKWEFGWNWWRKCTNWNNCWFTWEWVPWFWSWWPLCCLWTCVQFCWELVHSFDTTGCRNSTAIDWSANEERLLRFSSRAYEFVTTETDYCKILVCQFHIQVENAVVFLENRTLILLVVAETGYERNVSRFRFVAFQFHRWTKHQCNQWTNASDGRQQSGLADDQISGIWIIFADCGCHNVFTRRILQSKVDFSSILENLLKTAQILRVNHCRA